MGMIAVTSINSRNVLKYQEAAERAGAQVRVLTPHKNTRIDEMLHGVGGLLLTGGPDIDPVLYGDIPDKTASLELAPALDQLEYTLLDHALAVDMPVLAICRGMQLLNVAFGGKLIQDIPHHRSRSKNGMVRSEYHQIYLSPGSKLAAILGMGGFFRVNSIHHQGLREAQKATRLLASAYSLEDGLIEGLESPEHDWVVGIQCRPERIKEVPKIFINLFTAFVERAEWYKSKEH